jgi:hypothetical protein
MAETAGLVQKLTIVPSAAVACVWLGPTPNNTTLLFVSRLAAEAPREGSFENSMIDALASAAVARREVVATHPTNDSRITGLRIDPA